MAALDAAIALGIPYGGWIPKRRLTENGKLPDKYRMKETPVASYTKRTEKNVIDSEGALIVSHGQLTGGSRLTSRLSKTYKKPWIHVDLELTPFPEAASMIREWIIHNGIKVMNVAGPRASKDPRIYQAVKEFLEATHDTPNYL